MRTLVAGAVAVTALAAAIVAGTAPAQAAKPIPACKGALLKVAHTQSQGAAGHGNLVLRFRNISQSTCSLFGYPGMDALGPRGGVEAHARRTLHGFTGGTSAERRVVLHSWQVASADLEWTNFGAGGRSCLASRSIAVTPAGTFRTVRFPVSVSICSLQIHPTVAGLTGNG